jgi:hypothetical protein
MVQVVQKRNSNFDCTRPGTKVVWLVARAMIVGGLMTGTGCQMANGRGVVRWWADVNSLGGRAAFVDQMRTDGFRTPAPPTVLYNVQTTTVPRDVSSTKPDSFEVFPSDESDQQVQQTSGEVRQPMYRAEPAGNYYDQRPVKPAGAWLF